MSFAEGEYGFGPRSAHGSGDMPQSAGEGQTRERQPLRNRLARVGRAVLEHLAYVPDAFAVTLAPMVVPPPLPHATDWDAELRTLMQGQQPPIEQ